jgi:hypothetical protein
MCDIANNLVQLTHASHGAVELTSRAMRRGGIAANIAKLPEQPEGLAEQKKDLAEILKSDVPTPLAILRRGKS